MEQIYKYVAAFCLNMMQINSEATFMVLKVQLKKGISARLSRAQGGKTNYYCLPDPTTMSRPQIKLVSKYFTTTCI